MKYHLVVVITSCLVGYLLLVMVTYSWHTSPSSQLKSVSTTSSQLQQVIWQLNNGPPLDNSRSQLNNVTYFNNSRSLIGQLHHLNNVHRTPSNQSATPQVETHYILGNPQWTFTIKPKLANGTDGELLSERDQQALWSVDRYIDSSSQQFLCGQHLLVLMVESSPKNSQQRQLIRRTWGKDDLTQSNSSGYNRLRTLFVLGHSGSKEIDALVLSESNAYGDIVMGNFTDHYRNLTIKSLFGIQMIYQKCQFSFLFKTDDDCFVNTGLLLSNIENMHVSGSEHVYIGRRGSKGVPRDAKSKWYLAHHEYPFKELPPFILGAGYLLSALTVQTLLQMYKYTPFIVNEDVFVGYVLSRSNVKACKIAGFYELSVDFNNICSLNAIFTIHRDTPFKSGDIDTLYNNSLQAADGNSEECSYNKDIINTDFVEGVFSKSKSCWLRCGECSDTIDSVQ